MIPVSECVEGGFYRISSRNLSFGVFVKEWSGFIGVREKFFCEFLFTEFHHDTGPPFGTVVPKEYLGQCPIAPLIENNPELFSWLKEQENDNRTSG